MRTAIIIDDEEAQQLVRKRQAATVFTTEAVPLRCVQLGSLTTAANPARCGTSSQSSMFSPLLKQLDWTTARSTGRERKINDPHLPVASVRVEQLYIM